MKTGRFVAVLALGIATLWPLTVMAAPFEQSGDHLELAELTTRAIGPNSSTETIPFQATVNYRLQSASSGFLLLFVFENNAKSSNSQSSASVPVQSGAGQATLSIDYPTHSDVRTLTLMVALFQAPQKLLTWVSTNPIDLAPWPARAEFEKAMAARLAGDYASADSYLSAAIQAAPDTGNYYYWRGDTRIYLTRYDAAIDDFTRSMTLMPEDRASRVGRGVGLLWKGDLRAAIDDLSLAIDHSPDPDRVTAYAYRARGTAYAGLDRAAEAIADYQAYLQLMPDASDRDQIEGWIADLT